MSKLKLTLVLLLLGGVLSFWFWYGGHQAALGDAGNKFEALNSLFSALAFIGMICALFLQKKELDETRKELAITAQANKESAEIAKNALKAQMLSKHIFDLKSFIDDVHQRLDELSIKRDSLEDRIEEANEDEKQELRNKIEKLSSEIKMLVHINQRYLELNSEYTDIMRVVWPEGKAYFGTGPSMDELRKQYPEDFS